MLNGIPRCHWKSEGKLRNFIKMHVSVFSDYVRNIYSLWLIKYIEKYTVKNDKTFISPISLSIQRKWLFTFWNISALLTNIQHIANVDMDFPGSASSKTPAWQRKRHERHGSDPWVGKILWRMEYSSIPEY